MTIILEAIACGNCTAPYVPTSSRQKWCSPKCGKQAHYQANKQQYLDARKSHKDAKKVPCADCGAPRSPQNKFKRCRPCTGKARRGIPHKTGRHTNSQGYVTLTGHHDHPNAFKDGQILEHVLVMSEKLGRSLFPKENVHHLNGVRDDNRVENLELWVTLQPKGQRPKDLVEWAHEILARYEA